MKQSNLISPADRTLEVQEYYFAGKLKQLDEMRKQGIFVINLGIGSPDQPPARRVTEVLSSASSRHENHGYQSYTGIPALRKAFADWYLEHFGVELNPDSEILPLMGSKEGIMHISMAFVNEGDEVLIPNPGYPAYESVTRMIGGKVRFYDLVEGKGWLPDLEALEAEGLEKVKLMWVNYPHMPSGTKASIEFFRKLVEFGRRNHILICNDNPYSFILNEDTLSLLSIEGSSDVCLELNSLSKSHNMAGWRIGMVAGNSVYIKSVLKMKSNMDSGMFRPLQEAAVEALKSGREWYEKLNETYRRRRELAEQLMEALDCSFDSRQSGLFLWGRIPESYDHSEEFTDQILDSTHVFITPGFIFGSNGSRFIRISLCSDEATLKESIQRVEERFTAKNLHQTA